MASGLKETFKKDFLASIVVFLVALPLCMGIALASGAPPVAGIITGVIAGLVVGWLAGSPLQVSGPAAGLAVVVYEVIQRYTREYLAGRLDPAVAGNPDALERFLRANEGIRTEATAYAMAALGLAVLLAGVLQVVAGVLRWGQWFRAVSPAVIHGMLAGIGVLIFASQFHVMVDDVPRGTGLQNLLSVPEAVYKGIVPDANSPDRHRWAAGLGLLTIVSMVLWKALAPKRLKVIPAPLLGVILAVGAALALGLADQVNHVEMPDNLLATVALPDPVLFGELLTASLVGVAVTIAVVASAETLLCATAIDQMHQGPRTKYDRELTAQGLGNILCGAFAGLPMTGVIVRSATNVEAGAKTRLSAVLHGLWLLVFVCLCPFVLRLIPTASLAAILVYTGYKLMNPRIVRDLWAYGKGEVAIFAATVIMIVATDLLKGVLLGVALSAAKLLHTFARLSIRLESDAQGRRIVLRLRGAATFLRLPKLAGVLESVPPGAELHVHFEQLSYIDHACLDLFLNWERQHEATGGSLVIDWDNLTARFHRPGTAGAHDSQVLVAAQPNGHPRVDLPHAAPVGAAARQRPAER